MAKKLSVPCLTNSESRDASDSRERLAASGFVLAAILLLLRLLHCSINRNNRPESILCQYREKPYCGAARRNP